MMGNELTKLNTDLRPMDEVNDRINKIRTLMKSNMKDNVHFGKIPGCGDKPALLKPGAEMICTLFQFSPEFEITVAEVGGGHREYQIITTLYHTPSGLKMGQGVGSCSTMENKYRFRWENTGAVVPKEYWDTRNKSIIGGESYSTRKVAGTWYVFQKIEYDNPADYYNTCLKMAKKRSLVDAVITATGVSELFTQDIEDMVESGLINGQSETEKKEYTGEPPVKAKGSNMEKNKDELAFEEQKVKFNDEMKKQFNDSKRQSDWLQNLTSNEKYKGVKFVEDIKSEKQLNFIKGKFRHEFETQKDLIPGS